MIMEALLGGRVMTKAGRWHYTAKGKSFLPAFEEGSHVRGEGGKFTLKKGKDVDKNTLLRARKVPRRVLE